ncbi:MAG: alanine racemase [Alphaproteobacteria bacterium]
MSRPTTCALSTENLLHNVSVIRATAPRAKLMAMVKANAYGHGAISVGQRLEGHVDAMGVASIDEALALRAAGIKSPLVLIEGVFEPDELRIAAEQEFHVVFHTPAQVQWLVESPVSKPLVAWLKIDTGMGRLGFLPSQAPLALQTLSTSPSIRQPVGIMSHFACADAPEHPHNKHQIACFEKFAASHNGPKSLCNSAAIFSFPDQHYDWVRAGLSLYGATPFATRTAESLGLKPVMTFRTRLIAVKNLKRGDTIGYGARFTCPEDMSVGIMAVGYGDGYPRTARDGTPVLVNGARCSIAGRVSMDMAAVDLRPCRDAAVNTEVILWGEGLPIETVAATTENINYDLLTGIQNRVKYIWSA